MGHLKLGGRISEVRFGGADMIRIDIPGVNDSWTTQYIGGSSVYRITFCDEITARAVPGSTVPPVADFDLLKQLQNRGFTITGPQAVLEQSEFEEAFDGEMCEVCAFAEECEEELERREEMEEGK
jgi:hypothetical protein